MASMLIVGRGWLSLGVAIMANARGHDCLVVHEDGSSLIRLLGGQAAGPVARWLETTGLSQADSFFHPQVPSLLYLGEQWELLGLEGGFTNAHEAERNRFFHGLSLASDPVFLKIREDLGRAFLRSEPFLSPFASLSAWISSGFSAINRLLLERTIVRDTRSSFPWSPFLSSLGTVSGLCPKESLTVFRIFLDLYLGLFYRADERALSERLTSLCHSRPGIRLRRAGDVPVSIRKKGRYRFVDETTGECYNRVVDLSSPLETAGPDRFSVSIPQALFPDCWPDSLLLPDAGSSSMIWQVTEKTGELLTGYLDVWGGSGRGAECFPEIFLSRGAEISSPVPVAFPERLVSLEGMVDSFQPLGAYGKRWGGLCLLPDPLRLPFVGDDWFLSLYRSIPNLLKHHGP